VRLFIIIPTYKRAKLLPRILGHLQEQTSLPSDVIVSAPDQSHVVDYCAKNYRLSFVFGAEGLCAQRNAALNLALESADIVTFFDDDFIPEQDYIKKLLMAFDEFPNAAVITGNLIADGAKGPGLSFEEGIFILQNTKKIKNDPPRVSKLLGAYGCNMSIRAAYIRGLRFDERLVLYGWQEDIDFTSQLRRYGDVIKISTLRGVHLGIKSGRVSGVRFGYSQICNPIYLVLKGTMPATFALERMSRNLLANTLKSFRPELYIDRRGRLRGNLLAIRHLLQGRIKPEYVLEL
jgi:glycosyltransferase involved in cell wall biosynthesis